MLTQAKFIDIDFPVCTRIGKENFAENRFIDGLTNGQKEERERIMGMIKEASKQIHGGGNGRRILTELLAKINEK